VQKEAIKKLTAKNLSFLLAFFKKFFSVTSLPVVRNGKKIDIDFWFWKHQFIKKLS
jgi:hypothetical protein